MRKLRTTAYLAFAAAIALGTAAPKMAQAACAGDCNDDGKVTITEVLTVIDMALGQSLTCSAADADGSGTVEVNDAVAAVTVASGPNGACPVGGVCGDGVKQAGEDCDVGGSCVGGAKSGTACTSEGACCTGGTCDDSEVADNGVCDGGTHAFTQCAKDSDCGGGSCRRCKVYGGAAVAGSTQTCGANCTFETEISFTLKPGSFTGTNLNTGSGAIVHSGILGDVPLSLSGSQVFSVAKPNDDGVRPFTLKAASVQLAPIPVSTLACACVRGIPAQTCGGFVLSTSGDLGVDCTPGYTDPPTVCPANLPCAYVHGPGNSGTGLIGCGASGLTPINLDVTQDSRGSSDPTECLTAGIGAPICADPPVISLSGTSTTSGSTILVTHTAIGVKTGSCAGFCTEADPISQRGSVNPLVLTTGNASGLVKNADGADGIDNGPYLASGGATSCSSIETGNASGTKLAGAFTAINQNMLGDIVVNATFEAQ